MTRGEPEREPTPEERRQAWRNRFYWNLQLFGLPAWVRDLCTLALIVMVVLTLTGQDSTLDRQREGRKLAIEAICGVQRAVISAGQAQLRSGANIQPPRFERNLEQLGYPSKAQRQKAAEAAARGYARSIAEAVQRESGVKGLVDERTGSLHCTRLVKASGATP